MVIAWVDGSDPVLAEKRNHFLAEAGINPAVSALPTYYASNQEIRYCVLSILKFAPFVRNIFIVTDGQDPDVAEDVKKFFPERLKDIRLVDHTEIFRGYEAYLPTFGSMSIEALLWRIDGLAEHFVYFNDDIFLIREVQPTDWFLDGLPVLQGAWRPVPLRKMLSNLVKALYYKQIRGRIDYRPKFSFYLSQWHAASLLGRKIRYFFNCHVPYIFRKSSLSEFLAANPEALKRNLSFRFRDQQQFNVTTLANHIEIRNGNKNIRSIRRGYLHPGYPKTRLMKKIRRCETDTSILSVCVQSLDRFSEQDRQDIFRWLDKILDLPHQTPKR